MLDFPDLSNPSTIYAKGRQIKRGEYGVTLYAGPEPIATYKGRIRTFKRSVEICIEMQNEERARRDKKISPATTKEPEPFKLEP